MSTPALTDLGDDLAAAALTLARRFYSGATMWCLSPSWPHHARHVAVEFVHPVIVGKRALPAVMLPADDVVAALRVHARPGDVAVIVSTGDEPTVLDAVQRAPAWGVETVWIGRGTRPPAGLADHVVWLGEDEVLAPYDGRFIFCYHVLWELTHVCFEHPGLLKPADDCSDEVCITCSDEGRLAEVESVADDFEALVRSDRGRERVDTTLVGPLRPYDLVLVHAGSVIERVEPRVARTPAPVGTAHAGSAREAR